MIPTPVPAYDTEYSSATPAVHSEPEQSGIIGRGIDFRTDFYALGATLFRLCTGQLPYPNGHRSRTSESDSLTPTPPNVRRKYLPGSLNGIILKLLAPYPEDRYLSVGAIKRDLERCRKMLENVDNSAFDLALNDVPEHFVLSEKLRERRRELTTIEERLIYLNSSDSSLVALAGGITTGKSSLLRELGRFTTQKDAAVITAQNESTSVDVPYHAISSGYRDLVSHMLTLDAWESVAKEIRNELDRHLSVVYEVLQQLEAILGQAPGPSDTPDARHSVVRDNKPVLAETLVCITRAFCKHPTLVISLEDMQWADFSTLELIELLLQADPVPGLMIACIYRTNDITERPKTVHSSVGAARSARGRRTWLRNLLIRYPRSDPLFIGKPGTRQHP